jgi:hypothetical protein
MAPAETSLPKLMLNSSGVITAIISEYDSTGSSENSICYQLLPIIMAYNQQRPTV